MRATRQAHIREVPELTGLCINYISKRYPRPEQPSSSNPTSRRTTRATSTNADAPKYPYNWATNVTSRRQAIKQLTEGLIDYKETPQLREYFATYIKGPTPSVTSADLSDPSSEPTTNQSTERQRSTSTTSTDQIFHHRDTSTPAEEVNHNQG